MSTLYLDRKNLKVLLDGEALSFYEADAGKQGTVPLRLLERVILRGSIETDTRLLAELAEQGIAVLMLSGRHSRATGMVFGKSHNDIKRRLAQYQAFQDNSEREQLARWLVLTKLRAQKRLLQRAISARPDQRHSLLNALKVIEGNSATLQQQGKLSLESLRGLEGSAAAAYFKGLQALFPPALEFNARVKRPPTDPVNACLSLGYTLLHFEAVQSCYMAGLEPLLGFYHDPAYGRESLACDLIEPLRAQLDALIWRLFKERLLRAEHFTKEQEACLLGKTGRKLFYAEYESFVHPLRRLLRRYARALATRYLDRYPARL